MLRNGQFSIGEGSFACLMASSHKKHGQRSLVLGREKMLAVMYIVGFFRYQAAHLRAFGAQSPAEGS
jgi:hypothetical protein